MKEEHTDKEKVEYFKRVMRSQHRKIMMLEETIKKLEEVKRCGSN